jgi:hypothetical protein
MKYKAILVFLAISLCTIGCTIGPKTVAQETPDMPDEITALFAYLPEGVLMGIGKAKEASDGESILSAQDLAREDIARQMNTWVQTTLRDHKPVDPVDSEGFTEEETTYTTNARLTGSVIQKLVKTNDGTWWCVVWLSKITPRILSTDVFEEYMGYSPDLARIRAVRAVPDWVFNPAKNTPEDWIYCIGAAKGRNNNDAIRLATERARRSIAHSLDCEVSSVTRIFKSTQDPIEQEENDLSITSEYDSSTFETIIVNAAKTTDGTWWILLGYPVSRTYE